MSDSVRPQRLKPTRLPCPRDFPGKNTGVGCHFLLQGIFPIQRLNPILHMLCSTSRFFTAEPLGKPTLGFCSVQFSRSVMSDSLQPRESQHARPPCPSYSRSLPKPMSIESVMPLNYLILCRPLLLLPQSLTASESFPMSQLFA